ncbi:hypothetical protein ACH4TQ_28650 [Streptomyces sp. NPDC021218]|uniref:hypothetical protein n=1 Tax=Streptomyces sp. NPDC021218 TaxID=3365119 RepID=UPI003792DEED
MDRWDQVGRLAAYGSAVAMAPYAVIKVSWVVGSLLGLAPVGAGFGLVEWVVLNTVTVGMAAVGITLGLALARPWGMRLPGGPLVFCAWVGAGFLVSLLPYALADSLLSEPDTSGGDNDPKMPGWEAALIQFGFIGMGLGLTLALPAYLRRRWPEAFTGRGGGPSPLGRAAVALGAAVGLMWLYWAAGGTTGLAHPAEGRAPWRLLCGICGTWALVAAFAVARPGREGPGRLPRWLPSVLGWLGSGSLFAWSGWKLPLTLYVALAAPPDVALPERLGLAITLHLCAVVAGGAMMWTLTRGPSPTRPEVAAAPPG